MSDALKRRLAADLDDGFVELVDQFGGMVVGIARRLGDPAAADDATQETFLRAYRSLQGRDAAGLARLDLRPWIATIARNVVRNEWRRRGRRPTSELRHGDALAGARLETPSTEDIVVGAAGLEELACLLERLPARQRDAVVLRHVIGLSTRETAEVLGCPAGTVKSDVSRGLVAMRSALHAAGEETT